MSKIDAKQVVSGAVKNVEGETGEHWEKGSDKWSAEDLVAVRTEASRLGLTVRIEDESYAVFSVAG